MAKPKMVGTINGYSRSHAKFKGRAFIFDGTTLGLVRAAMGIGAKAGDTVQADFGGGFKPMTFYSNPADDRCNGVWAR